MNSGTGTMLALSEHNKGGNRVPKDILQVSKAGVPPGLPWEGQLQALSMEEHAGKEERLVGHPYARGNG